MFTIMNKTLTLTYRQIVILNGVLAGLTLDSEKSSARRRFNRIIDPHIDDYNAEVEQIKRKYSEKNKDGQTIAETSGAIVYTAENRKKCNADIQALEEAKVKIDVLESNLPDLSKISDMLKGRVKELEEKSKDGYESIVYDTVCEINGIVESLNIS